MSRPTISVITPTHGRSTIIDVIGHVLPQLLPGDEFIVVGDGPQPFTAQVCAQFPRVSYYETPEHTGDMGCTPCDYGIALAKGDFVMFMGDDNRPTPLALKMVREGVAMRLDRPHIFAMYHTNRILCDSRDPGKVDGHQIVIPRDMTKMPMMADVAKKDWHYSDWVFIDKVLTAWGGVMYHPDVIAILERQHHGAML